MTKVIISGGGTGGHIFPAIAIANAIRAKDPGADILFVGARGRMEMDKVPAAGYPIVGLGVAGFQRRITWKNLAFPLKLAGSMIQARKIVKNFKPDVVVGVGGYASGPTLRTAIALKIPTLIQEQNSFPGVTNRILAPRVDRICVAYEGMERWFPKEKILFTGNPVRQDILSLEGKKADGFVHFGLDPSQPVLLVTGGSLGAGTLNESIFVAIMKHLDDYIQILWQTGSRYYAATLVRLADGHYPSVKVVPFIDRMDLAYAIADIVVSRAGAIAISELSVAGKPAILVPSPNVAEDHQARNAAAMESRHAAVMIRDAEALEKMFPAVMKLVQDPNERNAMAFNVKQLALADAAARIAAEALTLAEAGKRK